MSESQVEDSLSERKAIKYAVLQRNEDLIHRFPKGDYLQGSASELASLTQLVSVPKGKVEEVADEVAFLIDLAAHALITGLSEQDCKEIANKVYLHHAPLTAFRVVSVLWLDAMLVQSHLRRSGVKDIDLLPSGDLRPSQLVAGWRGILDRNWHSIFAPAIDVLESSAIRARGATARALEYLASGVEIVEIAKLGNHINIGAELFPKISVDRKEAAAFYTTPATSEFLASLLIRKHDRNDWSNPELFRNIRVADFACGTGSLVRAAYRRIHDLGKSNNMVRLHSDAMEGGVTAVDVSPIAAHLTNSSMALMGGGQPYGKTNIGWVGVGQPTIHGLTTGSLEFLQEQSVKDMFSALGGTVGGIETEMTPIDAPDRCFDYVIMNPPYSRTRGGQSAFDISGLTGRQRQQCQLRWGDLIKGIPAVKTAGMAASFLCLAHKKVKAGGRIGFVLPLTAAFAETWRVTREMIVHEFKDIVAVTRAGGKGGDEALSADTDMGEMLLVATRKKKSDTPSSVRCVTLRRIPLRHGEAREFGRSVQDALDSMQDDGYPVVAGAEELGQIASFMPKGGEPWSHLGVLHADLAINASALAERGLLRQFASAEGMRLSCPMTTLEQLFEVGPTHHLIGHIREKTPIGAFVFHPITRQADARGSNRALWEANAKTQTTLSVDPTHKGSVWRQDAAKSMGSKVGKLHYARGMRWTSQALLAATTRDSVFGGRGWTSLLHDDIRVCHAFALWANSTLGLITHWTQGGRTHLGRSPTQVRAIQTVPCPDLARLGDHALDDAATAFARLSDLPLKPACQAHVDENRKRIDEAVIAMFGLPLQQASTVIETLRMWWCAEPTVHGDNQEALRLLARS